MRDYAPPLLPVKSGVPLIRSTPNLGWQAVRIRGRIDVERSLRPETRKKKLYWAFQRFVQWMEDEGHIYKGDLSITGPYPHAELKEPDLQTGDRGEQRRVARNLKDDVGQGDVDDYVIEATFWARERVQLVDKDVAIKVEGKKGIRLARPGDLEGIKKGTDYFV
ncbi:hypothetical protein LCGC14_2077380 [marine sediment metagenome]|uniref:Uncharacterized protein n=1 Tax=marine sediment metagenome TaxID=412755 RepID=A0A0F9F3Z0_9ZZZZ